MDASPLRNPYLSEIDGRLGTLRCEGILVGYVKFDLGSFWSPGLPTRVQDQVWFTVFDAEGVEGRTYDDYPPFVVVPEALEDCSFNLSSSSGPDQDCEITWADGEATEGIERLIAHAPKRAQWEFDERLRLFDGALGVLEVEGETVGYLKTDLRRYLANLLPPRRCWAVQYELLDADMKPVNKFQESALFWVARFLEHGRFNFRWAGQPEAWCHVRWTEQ